MTVISLIKDDACGEPNFRCRVIGKIGSIFGNGKHSFPLIEFPFGGLLGWIRGKIDEETAAAKIAKTHHVFAAVDKVLPLQWLLQKAVFS